MAKGNDVSEAVRKAFNSAKKNLVIVKRFNSTIACPVEAKTGSAKVMLKPAKAGRGIVAGGSVRSVVGTCRHPGYRFQVDGIAEQIERRESHSCGTGKSESHKQQRENNMQIHDLKVKIQKKKRRIGRGGKKGTYSGRGMKGQKSRSGANVNPIFEGGRSTLIEHLPKIRGFKSHRPKNQVVDLAHLEKYFADGDIVSPKSLLAKKIVDNMKVAIKILGDGEFGKKLTIEKCLVSKKAKGKIEAAGGKIA